MSYNLEQVNRQAHYTDNLITLFWEKSLATQQVKFFTLDDDHSLVRGSLFGAEGSATVSMQVYAGLVLKQDGRHLYRCPADQHSISICQAVRDVQVNNDESMTASIKHAIEQLIAWRTEFNQTIDKHHLLVPYHKNGNHWNLLVVTLQLPSEGSNSVRAVLYEPFGYQNTLPSQVLQSLANDLQLLDNVFADVQTIQTDTFPYPYCRAQYSSHGCGPIVAEVGKSWLTDDQSARQQQFQFCYVGIDRQGNHKETVLRLAQLNCMNNRYAYTIQQNDSVYSTPTYQPQPVQPIITALNQFFSQHADQQPVFKQFAQQALAQPIEVLPLLKNWFIAQQVNLLDYSVSNDHQHNLFTVFFTQRDNGEIIWQETGIDHLLQVMEYYRQQKKKSHYNAKFLDYLTIKQKTVVLPFDILMHPRSLWQLINQLLAQSTLPCTTIEFSQPKHKYVNSLHLFRQNVIQPSFRDLLLTKGMNVRFPKEEDYFDESYTLDKRPTQWAVIPNQQGKVTWPRYPRWESKAITLKSGIVAVYHSSPSSELSLIIQGRQSFELNLDYLPELFQKKPQYRFDHLKLTLMDKQARLKLKGEKYLSRLTLDSAGTVILCNDCQLMAYDIIGKTNKFIVKPTATLACFTLNLKVNHFIKRGNYYQVGWGEIIPVNTNKPNKIMIQGQSMIVGAFDIREFQKVYFQRSSQWVSQNDIRIKSQKIIIDGKFYSKIATFSCDPDKGMTSCIFQANAFFKADRLMVKPFAKLLIGQKSKLYLTSKIYFEAFQVTLAENSVVDVRSSEESNIGELTMRHCGNIALSGTLIAHELTLMSRNKINIKKMAKIINPTQRKMIHLNYMKRGIKDKNYYQTSHKYISLDPGYDDLYQQELIAIKEESEHRKMIDDYFILNNNSSHLDALSPKMRNKNFSKICPHYFQSAEVTISGTLQSETLTAIDGGSVYFHEGFNAKNYYTIIRASDTLLMRAAQFSSDCLKMRAHNLELIGKTDITSHQIQTKCTFFHQDAASTLQTIEFLPTDTFGKQVVIEEGEILRTGRIVADEVIIKRGGQLRQRLDRLPHRKIDDPDGDTLVDRWTLEIQTDHLIMEEGSLIEASKLFVYPKSDKRQSSKPIIEMRLGSKIEVGHETTFSVSQDNIVIDGFLQTGLIFISANVIQLGGKAKIECLSSSYKVMSICGYSCEREHLLSFSVNT